ncbi:TCP-1/cpn60 chaperonin family protein [Carboxydothermus ferrireducens]|uniref:Chaperonin GroEL (HSP60 family) n=1 Tax=Carboxydothermus ferrireducens DSM 11255 TaxID=1119529 RepID=A0ABX2R832_9THEO|nr:TCP-1/cpn60 chaperonin family protein [Carboxydothermus ferrireducens]NYE56306.1 chaperonin GroEL (HSP60 family) [Carboxydothermus ferrireducens DSM 11255]
MKKENQTQEIEERYQALFSNAAAVKALTQVVANSLGPKGLDAMLVDRFGEVVVTNDGVTILTLMDAQHPAARMVVNMARAQEREVGDGTTTAAVLAGALVSEGVNQILKGVPVSKVLAGMNRALNHALFLIRKSAIKVGSITDDRLLAAAKIAGRGDERVAAILRDAAAMLEDKLQDPGFKLADLVLAKVGADTALIPGVVINKSPLWEEGSQKLQEVRLLVLDDGLYPEEVEEEALASEAGFEQYLKNQKIFQENLKKLKELGVKLILLTRGISDIAEEFCYENEIMVITRITQKELKRVLEFTGARAAKRTSLNKPVEELQKMLGYARTCFYDSRLDFTIIEGGAGKATATVLIGAATDEVVDEQERIAKDAAGSFAAAYRSGVLPGGGAFFLYLSREVESLKNRLPGMESYGVMAFSEALKVPFRVMAENAGFNGLEKLGDLMTLQVQKNNYALGLDFETGEFIDMIAGGVVDPAEVVYQAVKNASEVAISLLKINTIIKMKDYEVLKEGEQEDGGKR